MPGCRERAYFRVEPVKQAWFSFEIKVCWVHGWELFLAGYEQCPGRCLSARGTVPAGYTPARSVAAPYDVPEPLTLFPTDSPDA